MLHVQDPSNSGETVLDFQGEQLSLLQSGGVWCERHKLLIVSDLHFGKGTSYASAGQLLPPYDTDATLTLVEQQILSKSPKMCISLGDSFHDASAEARLSQSQRARIRRLTDQTDWFWIEGNHDPVPPIHLGGRATHTLRVGHLIFRHEPTGATGEVAGHLHPVAKVKAAGRSVRAKCFVTDGNALILPSMGAYTGGLNVSDSAFSACLADQRRLFILGKSGVYEIAQSRALPDRRRA